jgi:malonyl-CoA decarboxylase
LGRESSASLIEQVSYHEAVHRVRTLSDLKQRLGYGRRLWAFTHPALYPQPLIFVETAVMPSVPSMIDDILMVPPAIDAEVSPSSCIFYSICSTHDGFQGIELGNSLIKRVKTEMATIFPSLHTFVTVTSLTSPASAGFDRSIDDA